MLFVTHYKLSNDVAIQEMLEAGETLRESGMWPPEGIDIIRWDTTVNGWGITVAEADDYESIKRSFVMWEALVPGMVEETKTAPASPVDESMALTRALLEELPTQE